MIFTLGQRSWLLALGDPKQRIYDFKGADPRRFDEIIAAFQPSSFDFGGEYNRSAGTDIARFADAMLDGVFRPEPYSGVTVDHCFRLYARRRSWLARLPCGYPSRRRGADTRLDFDCAPTGAT